MLISLFAAVPLVDRLQSPLCKTLVAGLLVVVAACGTPQPRVTSAAELEQRAMAAGSSVGKTAVTKLKDTAALERLAIGAKSEPTAKAAAAKLTDQAALGRIAVGSKHASVRASVVQRLDDQELLVSLATEHGSLEAIRKIADSKVLLQLALHGKTKAIKETALARIPTPELARLRSSGDEQQDKATGILYLRRRQIELARVSDKEFDAQAGALAGTDDGRQIGLVYLLAAHETVKSALKSGMSYMEQGKSVAALNRGEQLVGRAVRLFGDDAKLQALAHDQRSKVRYARCKIRVALLKGGGMVVGNMGTGGLTQVMAHPSMVEDDRRGALMDAAAACRLQPDNKGYADWRQQLVGLRVVTVPASQPAPVSRPQDPAR